MTNDKEQQRTAQVQPIPPEESSVGDATGQASTGLWIIRFVISFPWLFWAYMGFMTSRNAGGESFGLAVGISLLMLCGIWFTRGGVLGFFAVLSVLLGLFTVAVTGLPISH